MGVGTHAKLAYACPHEGLDQDLQVYVQDIAANKSSHAVDSNAILLEHIPIKLQENVTSLHSLLTSIFSHTLRTWSILRLYYYVRVALKHDSAAEKLGNTGGLNNISLDVPCPRPLTDTYQGQD